MAVDLVGGEATVEETVAKVAVAVQVGGAGTVPVPVEMDGVNGDLGVTRARLPQRLLLFRVAQH